MAEEAPVETSAEWGGEFDPFADPEEKSVLYAALDSFYQYRSAAHYQITHVRRERFYSLPSAHWELLAAPPFSIISNLDAVNDAIDTNADISEAIHRTAQESFGLGLNSTDWMGSTTQSDMDRTRSTLRQIYRDWSAEALPERHACFTPVLRALNNEHVSTPDAQKGRIRVLVPGAGLGRLVFELCAAGYDVEGNEISYHQLFASNFLLNQTQRAEQFVLFPWALTFSNHVSRADQLQKVMVPDVHPATALAAASEWMDVHAFERLNMTAGDFCVLYKGEEHRNSFDAVATVFFINTAPNLIAYIETIKNCLKPGGIWINLGPLLWHWESGVPPARQDMGKDDANEVKGDARGAKERVDTESGSASGQKPRDLGIGEAGVVELTDDEVMRLVEHCGFASEQHEVGKIATGYVQDPKSMLQNVYRPSFWVARKE
ncbi:N2227-like protein-domain-containing protein [Cryomyces antarcticus]|nr:hypothetical protein LTR04_000109 [Oleoguttula sp. CCFEE 6159]